jgi:hypothetical protein
MNRSAILLALGISVAGCNNPVCGPGTKQHQKSNGDVQCIPDDAMDNSILCDADAGATIVAGRCVSAITCGPNTKLMNGQCVGTGGMGMSHVPDPCTTPSTGKICINGVVRHLLDNSFLASGEMVHVAVYEPLNFLANPATATKLAEADTDDTFTFPDVPLPGSGLAAVAVSDASGGMLKTGTGAIVQAGKSYQVDAYVTPQTLVDTWHGLTGDDYAGNGAYVVKYFLDTAPMPTSLTATETMPASGVQVVQDTMVATRAKYFDTDLMTIGSATSTTAIGVGILVGDNQLSQYSGTGNTPASKWETHTGSTTANVVFVDRYHPCTQDGSGNCTN